MAIDIDIDTSLGSSLS